MAILVKPNGYESRIEDKENHHLVNSGDFLY